ncbi:MAG: hypothetical protein JWN02_792 [Acidobacteria bacterium]|nr:hypothetical protein [Acidobacteriota bacterium]
MRPIGFSTGALAKGDFRRGVELQQGLAGIAAVELSALRDHELPLLAAAIPSLDLRLFRYCSVHAPGSLRTLSEEDAFALLDALPPSWPIVAHPELLRTPSLWRQLGERLCIENMDDRKAGGRTVAELRELFALYPAATFCLDLGHARQIDPTLIGARAMLEELAGRLRQLHVSHVGERGEHLPLSTEAATAFARLAANVPEGVPVIIESVVAPGRMAAEVSAATAAFVALP